MREKFDYSGVDVETSGIPEGKNYNVWRKNVLNQSDFESLSGEERVMEIVNYGIMAPSTHNTQPWAFTVGKDGGLSVFLDKDRVLPASDPAGRQAVVSVGAAISFIEMASEGYGVETKIQIEDEEIECVLPYSTERENRYVKLASIEFGKTIGIGDDFINTKAMLTRRVNRTKEYDSDREVGDEIVSDLVSLSENGVGVHVLRKGDKLIGTLAITQGLIDAFVGNLPAFSRELGDWMKHENTKDFYGMPTSTFLLEEEFGKKMIKAFRGEVENKPGYIAGMMANSKQGIQNASIVGMVTINENSILNWIMAGKTMGEIGILLEKNKIENAYFAGIAEAADLGFLLASGMIGSLLNKGFSSKGIPVGLFRSGYGAEERPPHSPRASINSVLVEK